MMGLVTENNTAVFDAGRLYRYRLTRRWGAGPLLLWIMLNPSTADADTDDPTIRKCLAYARREAFAGIEVVNLFGFRATDPAALEKASDPVGPANDAAIIAAAQIAGKIVAAWGKSLPRGWGHRPGHVLDLLDERPVYALAKPGRRLEARHPLYLRGDAGLERLK